jgi:PAS domain S-box-containing protein
MSVTVSDTQSFVTLGGTRLEKPGAPLARAMVPLLFFGPVVAVGVILMQRIPGANWGALIPLIVATWIVGLAMLTGRLDSLSPNAFLAITYAGNVLLALAIHFTGVTDFGLVFLFLWEIPFVFHFFRLRQSLMLVTFTALCYAVLLAVQYNYGAPLRTGRWFALVGTGVLLGLSVHQLSQAARRAQQRFHSIFEHGPFGMVLVNAEGNILEVNPALERLAGRGAADLVGQPVEKYLHPDDLAGFAQALTSFTPREGEQTQLAGRIVQPDGSSRETMVTISDIRRAEGRLAGYVCIVEDLTERRRAERAEAENQAKSRFLALMSHELRTPLNAVLGFSQLLEHRDFGPLNDRQVRYVANIRTAGQNLLTLVNDLLDFSKAAAGRMDFRTEVVEVQALVDDAVSSMRLSADDKQLTVEQDVEPGLTAYADAFRLRQVMLNLLSNGIKFTKAGSVTVKAHAVGEKTCIAVADTGIGIPTDKLPELFSEFSQLDSGFARTQEGTGLGLALTKRLVIGMGGTLTVNSIEGEGSTFTVLIPRVDPSSA